MKAKTKNVQGPTTSSTLMPITVDVDLVRFEKNLLQIGFFGANDSRDKHRTTRRVEQVVVRNGSKVKVAAEFRGSEALGLPSTTDRDKFIALLKIMSEERVKTGSITNPIRFSGYRLIQELGLSRNGEIYEEILRWGKRMTDTTITSEQVVYQAAKKLYSDETLHVFRAFRRTGSSSLSGSERQENYEVVLEDWLLENLNQRYVIPEDFNAYKLLTRPTAKGIFGNLHLWFHASSGKPVEKDYADLCNLLNVQAYPHLSKIKSTMGLALNELVAIRYISKWDVQKMSSKLGYKIVLVAGEELLRILEANRPERREPALPVPDTSANASLAGSLTPEQETATALLREYGVLPAKAASLVATLGPEVVTGTVEFLAASVLSDRQKRIENPAGLIIYSLEKGLQAPSRTKKSGQQASSSASMVGEQLAAETEKLEARLAYAEWVDAEEDRLVRSQFSQAELNEQLAAVIARIGKTDKRVARLPVKARTELARATLRKELVKDADLPSFEQWRSMSVQSKLF